MKPLSIAGVALLMLMAIAAGACGSPPAGGSAPRTPVLERKVTREEALASFEIVRSVLQHPRCQNCHPGGDAPLQGDQGVVHAQNVLRGPEGKGMPGAECTTCHGPSNPPASYGAHVPPGIASGWRMPPPNEKLVFVGLTASALCEQVKDPRRNGGKDADALNHHLEDPLVAWGWSPGVGRAPVPVARPAFIEAWHQWQRGGFPCPPDASPAVSVHSP